ncbi:MAG: polyprenyl synthetase family protein [Myxococcota bacterium]
MHPRPTPALHPADWPTDGAIDLRVHDLPHASSTTEWWYVNTHLKSASGRDFSLFAAFFRVLTKKHPDGRAEYAHSLTWALSDLENRDYIPCSLVDAQAPKLGLEKVKQGHASKDERLNRAVTEVLEKNLVPRPDRFFPGEVAVATDRLALDFAGCRFEKREEGEYFLRVSTDDLRHGRVEAELTLTLRKPPVRHGDDGVVRGVHGEDMFYVFVPRCGVAGQVLLDGQRHELSGQGWYDHEFGCPPPQREQAPQKDQGVVAWNWVAAQLDDGTDVSVYDLVHGESGQSAGRWAVLSDPKGRRYAFQDFTLTPTGVWRSTRTFEKYPTAWKLEIPEARLSLEITAAFADQELVTVISKPAFWEGRCEVKGTLAGRAVQGLGFVERSGFGDAETLDDFFKSVGEAVREQVKVHYPLELSRDHANKLVSAPGREDVVDGVDLPQLARTLIAPVRQITDRGGKAWRSYASLACCDLVLGDSRKFAGWLAFPEFMHVGSLIVDDVQDRSSVRRGGPTAHLTFGEPLAINAGTAAYFMGERLLTRSLVKDSDKLKLYDLYFEALRQGHAGQAIDLDGLAQFVPEALSTGDTALLEKRVLAVHRLKTAAPAAALARMGAIVGGGTEAQQDAVGRYFDAVGLAFQIVDDVLNLRGFKGGLKETGEDISQGKVTLPVAKALGRLGPEERTALWATIASKPTDPAVVRNVIEQIEACGALDDCVKEANALVDSAWKALDPLVEASMPKIMLRAFGWYVLERHY